MKNYNKIRAENNDLQRLQEFKQPFTKFVDQFIYTGREEKHEDLCEFFLLQDSKEKFKNIDKQLEKTALKLARLLELKEIQLKQTIIQML